MPQFFFENESVVKYLPAHHYAERIEMYVYVSQVSRHFKTIFRALREIKHTKRWFPAF